MSVSSISKLLRKAHLAKAPAPICIALELPNELWLHIFHMTDFSLPNAASSSVNHVLDKELSSWPVHFLPTLAINRRLYQLALQAFAAQLTLKTDYGSLPINAQLEQLRRFKYRSFVRDLTLWCIKGSAVKETGCFSQAVELVPIIRSLTLMRLSPLTFRFTDPLPTTLTSLQFIAGSCPAIHFLRICSNLPRLRYLSAWQLQLTGPLPDAMQSATYVLQHFDAEWLRIDVLRHIITSSNQLQVLSLTGLEAPHEMYLFDALPSTLREIHIGFDEGQHDQKNQLRPVYVAWLAQLLKDAPLPRLETLHLVGGICLKDGAAMRTALVDLLRAPSQISTLKIDRYPIVSPKPDSPDILYVLDATLALPDALPNLRQLDLGVSFKQASEWPYWLPTLTAAAFSRGLCDARGSGWSANCGTILDLPPSARHERPCKVLFSANYFF